MPHPRVLIFDSQIGWIGMRYRGQRVERVHIGFATRRQLENSLGVTGSGRGSGEHRDRQRIRDFLAGKKTSLRSLQLEMSGMTPFQERVLSACREIPWGQTLTYGQLAERAGSPGASRAVGNVMANNRFPLIIPCHRVVARNGLGGFSAPEGTDLKRRLLENERATSAAI